MQVQRYAESWTRERRVIYRYIYHEKAESKDDNKKDEQKADKKQTKIDNKQQAKDDKQLEEKNARIASRRGKKKPRNQITGDKTSRKANQSTRKKRGGERA